ncbi:uncharacterized protein TRAVEDRAFT_74104 [Trametes versicolor FP-101664 SS1]|uniref:uncharacterized protein n=1 Tax=Trametes versicolor (strain FP-101664) TaxID=717944 RepID=UPI0004624015|nr:uncharacterized protein TRAVEDRAFT_74104 [Trametes versicolor FP-101664 SS1]EIW55209.1 hypothetical protein TRAVEDRAFT_74104 [Trametes versicolor FP-101664 SS1]
MSFLTRLFRKLRNPRGFVGRDLEGNQFFEIPGIYDDPRRTKRVVKYGHGRDMWAYIGGKKRLAVQWTAWLTHTRHHPPTEEELLADLDRQRRVLFNAAIIAARDQEEAARITASQQATVSHFQAAPLRQDAELPKGEAPKDETPAAASAAAPLQPPEATSVEQKAERQEPPAEQFSPWKKPLSDEPHTWQPRASVRRGG